MYASINKRQHHRYSSLRFLLQHRHLDNLFRLRLHLPQRDTSKVGSFEALQSYAHEWHLTALRLLLRIGLKLDTLR